MTKGSAGSTPVRRSRRSTAGQTPVRLGVGDGWSEGTSKWTSNAKKDDEKKNTEEEKEDDAEDEAVEEKEEFGSQTETDDTTEAKNDSTKETPNTTPHVLSPVTSIYLATSLAFVALVSDEKTSTLGIYTEAGLKAAPCTLLMLTVLVAPKLKTPNLLLVVALFCSLMGDVCLHFVSVDPSVFYAGVGFFALAHLAYIVSFLIHTSFSSSDGSLLNAKNIALPIILAGAFYASNFVISKVSESEGSEAMIMITSYNVVILFMFLTAYFCDLGSTALLGASLFVLSDFVIALEKFTKEEDRHPLVNSILVYHSIIIMTTYYAAQYLIVKSLAFV